MMATITARIIKTPIVINDEIKICDWPTFAVADLVDLLILVPMVEIHKEKVILMSFHVLIIILCFLLTFTLCASCITCCWASDVCSPVST